MKLKLSDLKVDLDIYPRTSIPKEDSATVLVYLDDLKNGAIFPPIEVQRISVEEKNEDGVLEKITKIIYLDGVHRGTAYVGHNKTVEAQYQIKEVEATYWKDDILDKNEHLLSLILRSAELNNKHGKRLTKQDAKNKFITLAEADDELKLKWKDIAPKFGVTPDWASECVSNIRDRKRASRDSKIIKMSLEGWTQDEIAKAFGFADRSGVNKVLKGSDLSDLVNKLRATGKTPEEITKGLQLDPALTWAFLLNGKTDLERFAQFFPKRKESGNELDRRPDAFNVWYFHNLDERLGIPHKMRIPGQIAMWVLYYFTELGDLIVDPMAGGGSTIDACLVMGRECRAYDIDPKRYDIFENDILEGYPSRSKGCDLIFLDPPYGDMVSFPKGADFYKFIKKIAENSYATVKKGGIVAFVMCDRTKGEYDSFISESYLIFKEVGFSCIQRISTPLSTQSANGSEVNKAIENKKLLGRDRVVYIFRKD